MKKKVFGNYNIKVGDVLIAKDDLINSPAFNVGSIFEVYEIEDDYLKVKMDDDFRTYYDEFHIESQNAELCELDIKRCRENKLKDLLDEA